MVVSAVWLAALYGVSLGALGLVLLLAWQHRRVAPAATWMIAIMLGAMLWCASALTILTVPREQIHAAYGGLLFGVAILAPAYYLNVQAMITGRRVSSVATALWLAVNPLAVLVLLFSPHTSPLLTGAVAVRDGVSVWHPGWLTWGQFGYALVLLSWAALIQYRAIPRAPERAQAQLRSNLTGAVLPGLGALASIATILVNDGWPANRPEWMAIAFLGTAAIHIRSFYAAGFLNVLPIARGLVFTQLPDAVLVLDRELRLTDLNPAARRLLAATDMPGVDAVGTPLPTIAASLGDMVAPTSGHYEVTLGPVTAIDLRVLPTLSQERLAGYAVVIRDVTADNAARRHLAHLNRQLTDKAALIQSLRHDLADQAERDSMTGLHNRRRLDKALPHALGAGDSRVCVALVDVDDFSTINNTYGRLIGDDVLIEIGRRLRAATGAAETSVRYGGDKFIVVSPIREESHARLRVRRIHQLLSKPVMTDEGPVNITLSVGLAYSPDHGTTREELLTNAHQSLAEAKVRGRNGGGSVGDTPITHRRQPSGSG